MYHLDDTYTVFGKIVSGMDVVEKIEKEDTVEQIKISINICNDMPPSDQPQNTTSAVASAALGVLGLDANIERGVHVERSTP